MRSPSPVTTGVATPLSVSATPFLRIETLEQLAAVVVTAGLVIGNFLMFTPWRMGRIHAIVLQRRLQPRPYWSVPSPNRFYALNDLHLSLSSVNLAVKCSGQ